jgi:hypothetical protein
MMSAHDVAVAALEEVTSSQLSESKVSESKMTRELSRPMKSATAASIQASNSMSKNAPRAGTRDANAFGGFLSSSSNNSQSTLADATTPPTSDSFSSQSQESQSQPSQISQPAPTQRLLSQGADIAPLVLSVATNAGQKRTRDGHVKSPNSGSSAIPPVTSFGEYSRHTSNISVASPPATSREVRFLMNNFYTMPVLKMLPFTSLLLLICEIQTIEIIACTFIPSLIPYSSKIVTDKYHVARHRVEDSSFICLG